MRTTHDMGEPEVVRDVAVSRTDVLVVAIMAPSTGVVQVSIDLMPEDDVLFDGGPFTLETTLNIGQAGVRLVLPVAAVADEGTISIQGQVAPLRDRPDQDLAAVSCSVVMDLGPESGIEEVMLMTPARSPSTGRRRASPCSCDHGNVCWSCRHGNRRTKRSPHPE